jgi:post-segregation antitoxin (ccd killing protein)
MKKIHLNLSVDEDLVDKARNHGLVISKFLENKLQEYFNFIDAVSNPKKQSKNEEWTCRG